MQQAIQKVKLKLNSKYDNTFHFFLSKPINQIVFQFSSSIPTISFIDAIMLSKNQEYMKRFYHKITIQGVNEIEDRISMLGQFYASSKLLKYQYPMMILTDTETIFRKRARRLKKIVAEQGSSDDTQENNSIYYYSFPSQHFLKDLSSVSLNYLAQNDKKNNFFSFDSSVHDIYEKQKQMCHQKQNQEYNQMILKKEQKYQFQSSLQSLDQNLVKQCRQLIQEHHLNHLIVNFNHQKNEKSDKLFQKNKRQSLKNILNTDIQKQKINIQTHQKQKIQHNFPNKTKKNFVGSFLRMFQNGKHRKNVFDFDFGNNLVQFNDGQLQNNKFINVQRVDEFLQKQKEQRLINRRKIRQKAQQLLKKVRNQQKTIKTYDLDI